MNILVTGVAGFIGFHVAKKLSSLGHIVTGIDNINDYYDVNLKYARLAELGIDREKIVYGKTVHSSTLQDFSFIKLDITDREKLFSIFSESSQEKCDHICHFAAHVSDRYSIENPYIFIDNNICGFLNILEISKNLKIKHLVYTSSSSIYGMNERTPFSVLDRADHPASIYAAVKRSNELMAHTYSHLYNIPSTGLRLFTVYGPWGRPDMAYYKFANAIMNNKQIEIYNSGNILRDFTYIDDVIECVYSAITHIPEKDKTSGAPYAIYNLGNSKPEKLKDLIEMLENYLGCEAKKKLLGMQPGDLYEEMADIELTKRNLGWYPETTMSEGMRHFTKWILEYERDKYITTIIHQKS